MKNCTHPAVRSSLSYVFDWNQVLLFGFMLIILTMLIQNKPFSPEQAGAPRTATLFSENSGVGSAVADYISVPAYNNPDKIMLLTGY